MRMLLTAQIPVEAGNKAIKDGSLPKVIQDFTARAKPEAIYFGTRHGDRCMFAVFDLASPADIPPLAEPFFNAFNASIEFIPVMDQADLQKGLSGL
jgi:hypothetical protein